MSNPKEIHANIMFEKKYTFCTLVTRLPEYFEMVESAKRIGFSTEDVEFIYFNNQQSNDYDGYSGLNRAIKQAKGEYLIFCHQDILFQFDHRNKLEACLDELNQIDPNWAVAGNSGRNKVGKVFSRITDPNSANVNVGPFPQRVMSLDENFIILNQHKNIAATQSLKGFHLYGLDICQNAEYLGYSCYVIDFHLYHKSGGNIDHHYYLAQQAYINKQINRKQAQIFAPICSYFFVSSSHIFNFIFNLKFLEKYVRSYFKSKFKLRK